MTVRHDDHIEQTLNVDDINSREDIRRFILTTYAIEDCNVKTRYYVETIESDNNRRIYIERPTFLNKGCDFVLFAEDLIRYKNGNDKAPSHKDVINDLVIKKQNLSPQEYSLLLQAIDCIYQSRPYHIAERYINQLPHIGWNYELLLKLLRWLFIEQDITYWAGEGRNMLYTAIKQIQ